MKRFLLALCSFLSILSCRQSLPLTEREKKSIIKEVSQTLSDYYNDIRKSGLGAEFKYIDSSSNFFWVPPGYSNAISFDNVAIILKQNASKYKYIDNKFESLQVIPLTKNLASYTGQLRSAMTDTSGNVQTFSLIETGVIIKRQEGWKLLNGQTSVCTPK
jgi:hypothetical protein